MIKINKINGGPDEVIIPLDELKRKFEVYIKEQHSPIGDFETEWGKFINLILR